jgi:protein tyrosine phosphatase (PTP) superfamily phosphohydrolase (DUF442 family)
LLGGIFVPNSVVKIFAFRQAAPDLATSGQPHEDELAAIAEAGYEVIINLALHDDSRYSLKDEASSVNALGLRYVYIPVRFDAPTASDLSKFFDAMVSHKHLRVWVHCAANKRVSAFLGLYRCVHEGWPEETAFALLREIWQPDDVWSTFIATQLAKPMPHNPSLKADAPHAGAAPAAAGRRLAPFR